MARSSRAAERHAHRCRGRLEQHRRPHREQRRRPRPLGGKANGGFTDDERVYQSLPYKLTINTTHTVAAARQEGHTAVGGSGATIGDRTPGQNSDPAPGPGTVHAGSRVKALHAIAD